MEKELNKYQIESLKRSRVTEIAMCFKLANKGDILAERLPTKTREYFDAFQKTKELIGDVKNG
jgi:hypothetical protein